MIGHAISSSSVFLDVHCYLVIYSILFIAFSTDKPSIEELQYFLDFQIQRVWAPEQNNARGHQRKEPVCPSLQFSLMGSKIFISSEQV